MSHLATVLQIRCVNEAKTERLYLFLASSIAIVAGLHH